VAFAAHQASGVAALRAGAVVAGFGMGLANTSITMVVQDSAAHEERGVATALTVFSRSIGGALAVGALGGLLAMELRGVMTERELAALFAEAVPRAGGPTPHRAALGAALVHVLDAVMALAAVAAFAGLALPHVKLGPKPAVP
jgi:hypothetical protein